MKRELIEVLRRLKELDVEKDEFISTIPRSINTAFFDNEFVTAQQSQIDLLIGSLFGEFAGMHIISSMSLKRMKPDRPPILFLVMVCGLCCAPTKTITTILEWYNGDHPRSRSNRNGIKHILV